MSFRRVFIVRFPSFHRIFYNSSQLFHLFRLKGKLIKLETRDYKTNLLIAVIHVRGFQTRKRY